MRKAATVLGPSKAAGRTARRSVFGSSSPWQAASSTWQQVRRPRTAQQGRAPRARSAGNWFTSAWWTGVAWTWSAGWRPWDRYWARRAAREHHTAASNGRIRVVAERIRHPEPTTEAAPAALSAPVPAALPAAPVRALFAGPAPLALTAGSTTSTGGSAMAFNIADLAAELHARAARYEPQKMEHFARDLGQWEQAIAHVGLALAAFTKKGSDTWPLHRSVTEQMATVYQSLAGAAISAKQFPATFRGAHAVDLRRYEQPRTGEEKWNV